MKNINFRLQATKFNFPSGNFLLINTYFPCDPRTLNFDDAELLILLSEIRNVIRSADCPFVDLVGDLNFDFSRDTAFTRHVKTFFDDINLKIFWENPDDCNEHLIENVNYTHLFIQANRLPSPDLENIPALLGI